MDAPAFAAPPPSPFDYEVAFGVARAVVAANFGLAEATGMAGEDLIHELAEEIWRAHDSFDPRIAKYGTFAGNVAHRRLQDRARSWGRHTARQRTVDELPDRAHRVRTVVFFGGACDELLLRIPQKINRGRSGHSARGYAAALVYREEHGLSWRTLREKLAGDRSLAGAMGFAAAPSTRRLIASRLRLARWARREKINLPTPN